MKWTVGRLKVVVDALSEALASEDHRLTLTEDPEVESICQCNIDKYIRLREDIGNELHKRAQKGETE